MRDKSKAKKTSKAIKAIIGIASTGVAVATAVVTMNKMGIFDKVNPNPDNPVVQRLDTVQNLAYDKDSQLLTWDTVQNADRYKLSINGDVQTLDTNSYYYIPAQKETSFKVQALDSSGTYLPGEWSSIYTYTMEDQKQDESIDLAKVDYFVNGLRASCDLKKITSMYIDDNGYYRVQGEFNQNGDAKVIDMAVRYNDTISSLSDAMTKDIRGTSINNKYDVAYYDSAQYLLDSHSYAGKMEEYRLAGYDFDVVSSCVGYTDSGRFTIYGTYKLTNGSNTKYLQNATECWITDSSPSEQTNYTTKLLYTDTRVLKERSCNELTGDLAEWAEKYDAKINAQTNSTQSTVSNTQEGGMEL